jgi:hypothetical protein
MHKLAICTVVLSLGIGTAFAQDKPKPSVEKASEKAAAPPEAAGPQLQKPDWSSWKWFMGTWKCTGSLTMGGNKADVTLTLNHKADLDGYFLLQTANMPKSKTNPMAIKWVAYMSGDASGSRYVVANNMGATEYGSGPATWSGDTLEFTGTEMSQMGKIDFKHTWKKVSDKEFHWTAQGTGGPGMGFDWTCKK